MSDTLSVQRTQYASTYVRHASPPILIRNATILTAAGPELTHASILFADGRIVAVGTDSTGNARPAGTVVVDGAGKYVTPGIIRRRQWLPMPTGRCPEPAVS